jgi:hypothetical protein
LPPPDGDEQSRVFGGGDLRIGDNGRDDRVFPAEQLAGAADDEQPVGDLRQIGVSHARERREHLVGGVD